MNTQKENSRAPRFLRYLVPFGTWYRFVSFFLILSLVTPPSALALRATNAGQEESPTKAGLEAVFAPSHSAGLEEGGIKILTVEKLLDAIDEKELAAEARAAGKTHVVLFPKDAKPASTAHVVHLYAQASVQNEAWQLLSTSSVFKAAQWRIHTLPEDPQKANLLLKEAARIRDAGLDAVIALDNQLAGTLQLPKNHPVVLLLSVLTSGDIAPAHLEGFLSNLTANPLRNLILDLTSGSIKTVTIQGREYYAIFA